MILLFNLAKSFFGGEEKASAYLHVVSGSAQVKAWGTEEFLNISSDVLVMSGDEIVSSGNAKFIVEYFDGSIMRMDGNTDVVFTEIMDGGDKNSSVSLMLVDGNLWFNKVYKDTAKATKFFIVTSKANIIADSASVFEVESGMEDAVRVLDGDDVSMDIMDQEGKKAVETEVIGIGQEVVLSEKAMDRYWKYQSPNVLVAISDSFKVGDWYTWNKQEDMKPTQFEKSTNGYSFVKVEPELLSGSTLTGSGVLIGSEVTGSGATGSGSTLETAETTETVATVNANLSAPTFTDVSGVTQKDDAGSYVVKVNPAIIAGGVPDDAQAVYVNDYKLQKFKVGDKTWKYYANASYGLMKKGDNVYQVYCTDASGNKSQILVVKVKYTPEETPPPSTGSGATGSGSTGSGSI